MEFLKEVDKWFLILAVFLLGVYFLWSVKKLFGDLKESINDLKNIIKELFDTRNNHEGRIVILETRMSVCESCNNHGHSHSRDSDK